MINIALIGTGNMGGWHARAFGGIRGCRVVAACDIDADRAAAFAEAYGIRHVYTDLDAVLDHPDLHAVTIVTPDHLHAPMAIRAASAGKHVFCEKPLALNYAEARTMVEAVERAGVINMLNFSYRSSAALQRAHRMVQQGKIGRVMHFEAAYLQSWLTSKVWGDWHTEPKFLWRLSSAHGSNGVLGDIGVHVLDFVGFPAGDFKSVQCRLKTFSKADGDRIGDYVLDANDTAVITAELTNGAVGTIQATRWATGHVNTLRLQIHGDKGALRIDLDRSYEDIELCTGRDVDTATWRTVTCRKTPNNAQRFIRSIRTGRNDQPDFARGAAVQQVIDACVASDAEGRAMVLKS
jgi:predicted dehydrogenase